MDGQGGRYIMIDGQRVPRAQAEAMVKKLKPKPEENADGRADSVQEKNPADEG